MLALCRSLLVLYLLLMSGFVLAESSRLDKPLKVMSVDWSQTETILALGITPVASAQQSDYNDWVRSPRIPEETVDVGLRTQPNLERLSELSLDKILLSPRFSSLEQQLSRIAPVKVVGLFMEGNVDWEAVKAFTRRMAKEVNATLEAENLISRGEEELSRLKRSLPETLPPVLLIQFMDAKHVRIFGENSIYKVALSELGIENGWAGKTNAWGFSLVGLNRLQGIKGQIVLIEPFPAGVKEHLESDQYWKYIVNQSGYSTIQLAPTWSFGALPSALRFANTITSALNQRGIQ